jgi:hypothetical protein
VPLRTLTIDQIKRISSNPWGIQYIVSPIRIRSTQKLLINYLW